MRELIRPTLFLVARLGFFLSVVVWGLAHSTGFIVIGDFMGRSVHAGLSLEGVVFGTDVVSGQPWAYEAIPRSEQQDFAFMVFYPSAQNHWLKVISTVPGITIVIIDSRPATTVGIHHWLVVTIFALFNGVLMWVYRKRGKKLADE